MPPGFVYTFDDALSWSHALRFSAPAAGGGSLGGMDVTSGALTLSISDHGARDQGSHGAQPSQMSLGEDARFDV